MLKFSGGAKSLPALLAIPYSVAYWWSCIRKGLRLQPAQLARLIAFIGSPAKHNQASLAQPKKKKHQLVMNEIINIFVLRAQIQIQIQELATCNINLNGCQVHGSKCSPRPVFLRKIQFSLILHVIFSKINRFTSFCAKLIRNKFGSFIYDWWQ